MGILGWVVCGPLCVAALIMGKNDLSEMKRGRMDRSGHGITQAGTVLGGIGTGLMVVGVIISIVLFVVLVLLPVGRRTLGDNFDALNEALMKRWKPFAHTALLLLFISGFYNYLVVTRLVHDGQGLYHGLFGAKFLLATVASVLFFIVTSTMGWSARLRQKSGLWILTLCLLVGIALIAGYMRVMPTV